jgi:hypothetical protein
VADCIVPRRSSPAPRARPVERLWRVRRDSRTVEALLGYDPDGSSGVDLQFLYNGTFVYSRRWNTRVEAEAEAADRLHELQIRGWATHW